MNVYSKSSQPFSYLEKNRQKWHRKISKIAAIWRTTTLPQSLLFKNFEKSYPFLEFVI